MSGQVAGGGHKEDDKTPCLPTPEVIVRRADLRELARKSVAYVEDMMALEGTQWTTTTSALCVPTQAADRQKVSPLSALAETGLAEAVAGRCGGRRLGGPGRMMVDGNSEDHHGGAGGTRPVASRVAHHVSTAG